MTKISYIEHFHLGMTIWPGFPILNSHIFTHYPTHIKRGWEIKLHPRPQRVQVSPSL